MTLAEFGAAVGVAKTTQASYERGERCPSVDYLIRVHRLGVDTYHVLTGVSAIELGRRSFQGDLLEDILISIDTWATEREQHTPPELKAELVRLFYEEFSKVSSVDHEHMMHVLRLVK